MENKFARHGWWVLYWADPNHRTNIYPIPMLELRETSQFFCHIFTKKVKTLSNLFSTIFLFVRPDTIVYMVSWGCVILVSSPALSQSLWRKTERQRRCLALSISGRHIAMRWLPADHTTFGFLHHILHYPIPSTLYPVSVSFYPELNLFI